MLKELSIRNFAIIDDLRIRFSAGLTIMSGETGAGKSIILNAVNLLLGSRASAELVRSGENAAELEALFDVKPGSKTAVFMQDHGFDSEQGLLIQRRISPQEGNRVYINGRLSTIQALITITDNLASISGQHAHQGLLKPEHHLSILDQFAGLTSLRETVAVLYHQFTDLLKTQDELIRSKSRQIEQIELLRFQEKEIQSAALQPGEDQELAVERSRLKHAEALYGAIYAAVGLLHRDEGAIGERLAEVRGQLSKSAEIDPTLASAAESISDMGYRLEDTVGELQGYLNTIQVDEKRLEAVEERLDILIKLKRKYGDSIEAILEKLETIQATLAQVDNIDERIAETESTLTAKKEKLVKKTAALSGKRGKAAKQLAARVEKELVGLKMADTAFQVRLTPVMANERCDRRLREADQLLTESGWDHAEIMIAPNVGEVLKPLAAIASGGELSRVVLALKSILAASDAVATVVFDEVDAGIGGGTAEVVGRKLAELARYHQIICITHLPQIAKFAGDHLRITKQVHSGRTRTEIQRLDPSARQEEVARMLGGEEITTTTLEHARELLKK